MRELLSTIDTKDRPILKRARDIYERGLRQNFGIDELRNLNSRLGTDIATAVLYVHFESKLSNVRELWNVNRQHKVESDNRPLLVAISPGAFYREHLEIGADGREVIELSKRKSWDCQRIPTESLGTLSENAKIINDFLTRYVKSHRVILVSLSKGTADAKIAKSKRPELFDGLSGWVNVSGVVHGTRMSDWLLDRWRSRPLFQVMLWYHQADTQAVRDLRYGPEQVLGSPFEAVPYPLIHVAGFPLRKHLSCWRAKIWHRRFRAHGPSDAVLMLEDLLRLPGVVVPVWGADHYMQTEWNVPDAVTYLIELLDGKSKASRDQVAAIATRDCASRI